LALPAVSSSSTAVAAINEDNTPLVSAATFVDEATRIGEGEIHLRK
jgi:hypothetical protein